MLPLTAGRSPHFIDWLMKEWWVRTHGRTDVRTDTFEIDFKDFPCPSGGEFKNTPRGMLLRLECATNLYLSFAKLPLITVYAMTTQCKLGKRLFASPAPKAGEAIKSPPSASGSQNPSFVAGSLTLIDSSLESSRNFMTTLPLAQCGLQVQAHQGRRRLLVASTWRWVGIYKV